ncbi:GNAT family N-acetyltransferase [bacterium]|nr:GNAT family N-acetyltransferase [bacterium]
MSLEVKVRQYKPRDLEQVLSLVRELETELTEKFKDVKIKSKVEDYRHRYLKPRNKYKIFVALVKDKVVGYLMGYPSLGAPEIDNMYDMLPISANWTPPEFYLQITFVSKPYRNQGISKALHRKIIDYAKKQGHKEVYACIAKWNLPELKVIQSLKFRRKDLGYRYRLSLKFENRKND